MHKRKLKLNDIKTEPMIVGGINWSIRADGFGKCCG